MKFSEVKAIAAQRNADAWEAAEKLRPPKPPVAVDVSFAGAAALLREALTALDTFEYEYGWNTEHDATTERIQAFLEAYESMSAPSGRTGDQGEQET